jgi:hypothetical protein
MQRQVVRMHVHKNGPGEDLDLDGLFETIDLVGLRAFAALDDVELYFVAFFEALVAFALDGTVVNEDVSSIIAAEESVAFCVIEPLYGAFVLCHLVQLPFRAMPRCRDLSESDAGVARGVFRVFCSEIEGVFVA